MEVAKWGVLHITGGASESQISGSLLPDAGTASSYEDNSCVQSELLSVSVVIAGFAPQWKHLKGRLENEDNSYEI